jgi:hypothetical protein
MPAYVPASGTPAAILCLLCMPIPSEVSAPRSAVLPYAHHSATIPPESSCCEALYKRFSVDALVVIPLLELALTLLPALKLELVLIIGPSAPSSVLLVLRCIIPARTLRTGPAPPSSPRLGVSPPAVGSTEPKSNVASELGEAATAFSGTGGKPNAGACSGAKCWC